MTVAIADAGAAKASPPPPPFRLDCAAAKALAYLGLASTWVGAAALAAVAVIDLATPGGGAYDVGFPDPVCGALRKLSSNAIRFGALLAVVVFLLQLRAAFVGLVFTADHMGMGINKVPQESLGSVLRGTTVTGCLAAVSFLLLSLVGCLVLIALSPPEGPLTFRMITAVLDVGILGSMVLTCFVSIPSAALKLWRMSPFVEVDAPADNIV